MKQLKLTNVELGFDLFPKRAEGVDPVRTNGLHLTDIIRSVMEDSGMQKTASGASWMPKQLSMAAEVGFMWEDLLSGAMKERLPCRIGEIELDGITMSPDGIEMLDDELILSEFKAVWASNKRLPVDNWKWMSQVKGYCKGLDLLKVKMYILYINGDWKGSGPTYDGFLIEFTQLEIDENWNMLVNHAKHKGWLPR